MRNELATIFENMKISLCSHVYCNRSLVLMLQDAYRRGLRKRCFAFQDGIGIYIGAVPESVWVNDCLDGKMKVIIPGACISRVPYITDRGALFYKLLLRNTGGSGLEVGVIIEVSFIGANLIYRDAALYAVVKPKDLAVRDRYNRGPGGHHNIYRFVNAPLGTRLGICVDELFRLNPLHWH